MEKPIKPGPGTCLAIISEEFSSSGVRTSFERFHGLVSSVEDDGYHVILGGTKNGQEFLIPHSGELRPLPGGHFYFEESDEWVAPLFMFKIETRHTN